jgi:multidrug efflux pump subunit AcrA (membrane-fusion protein)
MKHKIGGLLVLAAFFAACTQQTEETKPVRKDVTETVFVSGVLEANGIYHLTAQTDGYLTQVNFKENDIIQAGMVLATIDNKQNIINTEGSLALYEWAKNNASANAPSLLQAKNAAQIAQKKLQVDSLQAVRYKKLLDANSIARADYEQVFLQYQNSKTSYANTLENYRQLKQQADQQVLVNESQKDVNKVLSGNNQIRAVFTGRVYEKFKQQGDFVKQGDVIASIGDASFIYAKVSIDESNIRKVQVGQEAVIQLNTDKEKTYKGKVAEILPAFNEATQSFTGKLFFTDPLDFKIVNTQLQANIIVGLNKNALLIPRRFLDYGNFVTVKGKNKPVHVVTRFVSNEWVQVESGLDENAMITIKKTIQ